MKSAPAKTFISADVALIHVLELTAIGGKS
jgi:hypothetical protein